MNSQLYLNINSGRETLSSQEGDFRKHSKRAFGTVQYQSEKTVKNSFVLVSGEGNWGNEVWRATTLLLLKISARKGYKPAYFAFSQLME